MLAESQNVAVEDKDESIQTGSAMISGAPLPLSSNGGCVRPWSVSPRLRHRERTGEGLNSVYGMGERQAQYQLRDAP
jgi:hypothetical protein